MSDVVANLRFSSELPTWLILLGALSAGMIVMLLYLRETAKIDPPWSWLLPAMRGTAVVLACFLLAGPVWHHRHVIGNPARVVWAVDRSQSMSEQDSQTQVSPDRLRRATDLLFGQPGHEGWIEQLRDTHLMDVVVFDDSANLAWSSSSTDEMPTLHSGDLRDLTRQMDDHTRALLENANGGGTDLSSPLRAIAEGVGREIASDRHDEEASRAVVLFTDGRDSAGRADAGEVAARLADVGWTVHTIGIGSVDEPADIGIVDVDVPQRVADDGHVAGRVWVKHFGYEGKSVRVAIQSGQQTVWSDTVVVSGDGSSPVDFNFPVEPLMQQANQDELRGVDRDTVALALSAQVSMVSERDQVISNQENQPSAMISADGTASNDSMEFRIAAASRDRRLLILDGSARWETRYLRNLFSRDPAWEVDTVLFGRGTDMPQVRRGEDPGELPESVRAWSRYDAVILGEIPPDQWTEQDAEQLSEFVAGGGGLIVVDGSYRRLAVLAEQSIMAGMIPVQFDSTAAPLRNIRAIEPTAAGQSHPVMLLDVRNEQLPGKVNEIWSHLPAPTVVDVVTPLADAEVWAAAIDTQGKQVPWLVTRMYGAGRVFYLASDQTWRWRYRVENQLQGRFWNQLMTAAMQPPYAVRDAFVAIGTDKIDYRVGQAATIRVRLLNADRHEGESVPAATVDAVLLRDDQPIATVPLSLDDAGRRTYLGETAPLPAGEYRVRVRASGYDAAALQASMPFWVVSPRSTELDRVSVDEAALQRIATSGGGVAVHESSANEVLNSLDALSGGRIVESDTLLWQSWWMFAIMVALLAVEWWFRKKVGLL
ncbi:VWA domain-containing protein [Allorhodopirellula heiligendammensis]|uniref:von Willebrand factor type A domain protein n=1 Tax=Allorhodopirellula heiligendammensis TaxID=2714739 RepID=A0A5C6C5R1_9BACT|nr:VWA domain-containing protein [Allorhodopirellula heiligendammensis]TWU18119.1 von Willebrand factor type A domain protein [Allorhodopirellula heiligendammensis]